VTNGYRVTSFLVDAPERLLASFPDALATIETGQPAGSKWQQPLVY
jgi:hypothetical protein